MKRVLYRQHHFPVLQNRVYDTKERALQCQTGELKIVEDQRTGLIYNDLFRPELVVYDANYDNEQGLSHHFQQHLAQVADLVKEELGKDRLIEVGCGKGYFLEMLLSQGVDVKGFDATYSGNNPCIVKQHFAPGVIKRSAKGLILRHVLEHIPNPVDFLFQLKQANGGHGLIYIEVPCFDWICERRAWFDIFYEHVNYFRLSDFQGMFGKIENSGRFFGQQYLFVVADLASLRIPTYDPFQAINFPSDFLAVLSNKDTRRSKGPVCIWGGASKGVIFSLLRAREGQPVDFAIDINPAKQDRFLPTTGLLVHSPESGLKRLPDTATIYVMNSNYINEIKELSNYKYNYIGIDQ